MSASAKARRANGPIVALCLFAICGAGFLATVWNYTRNHAFAREAFVESNGSPSLVTASFPSNARVQPGQRVIVHIQNDSAQARGGIIKDLTPQGSRHHCNGRPNHRSRKIPCYSEHRWNGRPSTPPLSVSIKHASVLICCDKMIAFYS
jgi:hypothetical protein